MLVRVLISDFHKDWGGQPEYLLSTAEALRGVVATEFLVPTGSVLARRAARRGFPCHTLCQFAPGTELTPNDEDIKAARLVIERVRPDVVQVNDYLDQLPVAFGAHLATWPAAVFKLIHNSFAVADHWLIEFAYRKLFDHVGVVAPELARPLDFLTQRGAFRPEAVTVHHGGVDVGRFRPNRTRVVRDRPLVVGTVCRLASEKGIDVLLRAFKDFCLDHKQASLLIVGDGPERADLARLTKSLGMSRSVSFVGFRRDVRPWLRRMDVFALASVDCEGSSLAIKEAMAVGLPIVATDIGGSSAIVRDGYAGYVVEPNSSSALTSAFQQLASDAALRARMSRNARERVAREFSLTETARGLLQVYANLASRRRALKATAREDIRP